MNLLWSTATETNNDYFTIERSKDGISYQTIGIVDSKATGGNSTNMLSYSYSDNTFPGEEVEYLNNVFYYRLKQTNFDGNYSYSFISVASCAGYCISDIKVLADNNTFFINIPSICSTSLEFFIYNALGQIVFTKRAYLETGNNMIQLSVNDIAAGVYILKADTDDQTFTKKFVKQQY